MLQCKCNPLLSHSNLLTHDDVIKRKHFPRYWPFVRGIHRSLVNSPYKGQWRGALMFSLIGVWRNGWANNGDAGDSSPFRPHYDVNVMNFPFSTMNHCTMGAQRIQFTQLIFNPPVSLVERLLSKPVTLREADISYQRYNRLTHFLAVIAIIWRHCITGRSIHIFEQCDGNIVLGVNSLKVILSMFIFL